MTSLLGCGCKRGFLVLRDCGRAAVATCSECGRGVCDEHLAPAQPHCVDCAARRAEPLEAPISDPAGLGSAMAARERRRYYADSGYAPFMAGYPTDYYDEYDVRAFEDSESAQTWSGESGPSYLDS